MNGCKDQREDKFQNSKKRQHMSKETTITIFGMTSTSLTGMRTRMKRRQYLFTNLCRKLTLVLQRQIKWKASLPLIFAFILQEDAAAKALTAGTTIECRLSQTSSQLKITCETFLDDLVTPPTKKTLKALVRLTKNVTHFASVKYSSIRSQKQRKACKIQTV